jgi:hypothetical protein
MEEVTGFEVWMAECPNCKEDILFLIRRVKLSVSIVVVNSKLINRR